MRGKDIVMGMKVAPFQKTGSFGYENLEQYFEDGSRIALFLKKNNFLYIVGTDDGEIILAPAKEDYDDGDYFRPEDFDLYSEIGKYEIEE